MAQMTLKQLRYFVAAAESLSVTKAAAQLYVSQPSISAAINHIEQIAGIPLFIRHHAQGLSLTTAGATLLTRSRALLTDADSLLQLAISLGEDISGSLHLAAFHTFAHLLMPGLMMAFNHDYPKVSLHCDERHQSDIIEGLHKGVYDIAFGYDLSVPEDIAFTPLYEHPPYVVISEDHPLAGHESLSFDTLAKHQMVMLDWPLSRDYFIGLFTAMGCTPQITHQVTSVGMARELVSKGFGFSLFNIPLEYSHPNQHQPLKAIPLKDPARPLTIGILSLAGVRLAPAAEALRELALKRSMEEAFNRH